VQELFSICIFERADYMYFLLYSSITNTECVIGCDLRRSRAFCFYC